MRNPISDYRLNDLIHIIIALLAICYSYTSHASIQIDQTRLIYNQDDNGVALNIKNQLNEDILLQSWVSPMIKNAIELPIIVIPPLQHLASKQTKSVRVIYKGSGFPMDRETVFWLHVQEIPQKKNQHKNTLRLSIRNTLKVFWRPKQLANANMSKIYQQLKRQISNKNSAKKTILSLTNPTAYNLTINKITNKRGDYQLINETMPPFSKKEIDVTVNMPSTLYLIDDFGGFPELSLL